MVQFGLPPGKLTHLLKSSLFRGPFAEHFLAILDLLLIPLIPNLSERLVPKNFSNFRWNHPFEPPNKTQAVYVWAVWEVAFKSFVTSSTLCVVTVVYGYSAQQSQQIHLQATWILPVLDSQPSSKRLWPFIHPFLETWGCFLGGICGKYGSTIKDNPREQVVLPVAVLRLWQKKAIPD